MCGEHHSGAYIEVYSGIEKIQAFSCALGAFPWCFDCSDLRKNNVPNQMCVFF